MKAYDLRLFITPKVRIFFTPFCKKHVPKCSTLTGCLFALALLLAEASPAVAQNYAVRVQAYQQSVDSTFELSQISAIEFTLTPDSSLTVYRKGGTADRFRMRGIDSLVFSPDTANTTLTFLFSNGRDSTYSLAAIDSIVIPPVINNTSVPMAQSPDGMITCYPNPSTGAMRIVLSPGKPERIHLALYDDAGKLVRDFGQTFYPAGMQTIAWDGLDTQGRQLPNAAYVFELESSEGNASLKFVLTR
jgi:hypothetical protein